MPTTRQVLEQKAKDLNLKFVADTSDDDLRKLIADFEENGTPPKDPAGADGLGVFSEDTKFFVSQVPGLGVRIGDEPERGEQPQKVRFTPYEFWSEKQGEHYSLGYLATDESDAIEVLADDPNVKEISEEEYREAVNKGKRAKS